MIKATHRNIDIKMPNLLLLALFIAFASCTNHFMKVNFS